MHTVIQSPKKKRANKKRTKLLVMSVFVVVFAIFFGAVKIISLPSLQVTEVLVQGTKLLSPMEIKKKVEAKLSGNYFYFFPKKNIFLYPKEKIQTDILATFPQTASVRLSLGSSHEIIMNLKEREPFALWCGREKPVDEVSLASDCFYVDKTGYIFALSPRFSGDAYFTLYGGGSIKKGKDIGRYAVTPDVFQKALDLREFLLEYHISTDNIFFGEDKYSEFFSTKGFAIKWNVDQDITVLKSNMSAVFRSPNWNDNTFSDVPENVKPLEYLDFRFGNKIFYKQKGKEPMVPISTEVGTSTPDEISPIEPTT